LLLVEADVFSDHRGTEVTEITEKRRRKRV
jgi:hypothetical protein